MKTVNLEMEQLQMMVRQYDAKPKRIGKKGIIYTRVSSSEQAENNGSLEVQMNYCNEFAKRNQIPVMEYFGGTYESAKSDGRKEFQRMLSYVRKNKEITYIIVFNYDRFSRTGAAAAQLSEDLRKDYGIIVKSVTQDIDTSNASGRLQENMFHLMNNYDNQSKSDRTTINTREVMLKGYWPYATPFGYENLNYKQRACFHEYVITEEGKQLKKAFALKAEGKLNNKEIVAYLKARGATITEKNFRLIFSNPFYAGFVTGKLLEGKLIKGHHPPLIDLKTFLKANNVLQQYPNVGKPKIFKHDEVPLKTFVKDEISNQPLTGYITKNNWYYKTKKTAIPINVKAEKLNSLFRNYLSSFEYKKEYQLKLKKLLNEKLKERLFQTIEESKNLKKKITEKESQLEKVEEKFMNDSISKDLYEKYTMKYKEELSNLKADLGKYNMNGSNLEIAVEKCLSIAQNVSSTWVTASYDNKQRLQQLIFPEGVMYDKKNEAVRTLRTNSLFASITPLVRVLEKNKKGDSIKNRQKSSSVPRTGIEPALPCDNQILSLARLPIPPSGHFELGCNITVLI